MEEKNKRDQEEQKIKEEWKLQKKRKKEEMKSNCEAEFNAWAKKEESRHKKSIRKLHRQRVEELRKYYLGGQEDAKFPQGEEPQLDRAESPMASEAADNTSDV